MFDSLSHTIQQDTLRLFLGEYLGEGIARVTYSYGPDPTQWVVKVQTVASIESNDWQNIAEWGLWSAARPALARWLAPLRCISPGGIALIQRRCEPCPKHLIPKKVPKVLADLHDGNFGLLDGKPVLMDYGRHLALTIAANAQTMRRISDGSGA